MKISPLLFCLLILLFFHAGFSQVHQGKPGSETEFEWQLSVLEESILNLMDKYPDSYNGRPFLRSLDKLKLASGSVATLPFDALEALKKRALLAHPGLSNATILSLKIGINQDLTGKPSSFPVVMESLGLPDSHRSLSNASPDALASSIVQLDFFDSQIKEQTIVAPRVGELIAGLDLHWNGDRLLFSRRENQSWKIFEVNVDGSNLRKISQHEDDISSYEPCYLPDGDIVFASDASAQGVPCWHGDVTQRKVALLYKMDRNGEGVRQLCFDQGHNAQPTILKDGRVVFNRWDYTGMNRVFNRITMEMRPDGTNQRALYGTNTWYPNSVYGHKELPGSNKIVCIVTGYHQVHRCGYLGILDPSKGDRGEAPLLKIITGTSEEPRRVIMDKLVDSVVPLFTDPDPIDDDYFLVSVLSNRETCEFSVSLADIYGNVVPIQKEKGFAYFKPTLSRERPLPNVIPELVNLNDDFATVYIQDVYTGPGLKGVDRGVIKKVRVLAYDYGYPTLAGVDKIGMAGPWEVMQILGEAKVHADGSAFFKVPADTPIAFQMVDEAGQAIQLMRTWTTAMPGERLSCVGCHEEKNTAPLPVPTLALQGEPQFLDEWNGPARGFDFSREIQPILNRNCVNCHHGGNDLPDLRPREQVADYIGTVPSHYDRERLGEKYKALYEGQSLVTYTPAYEALVHYIRRVGAGDDVSLLVPGEYSGGTSPLIQILRKGHHGVRLSKEELEHFYTWIDLNGPCHGTWTEVFGVTPEDNNYELRQKYRELYQSKQADLEKQILVPPRRTPVIVEEPASPEPLKISGWPLNTTDISLEEKELEIGGTNSITMIRIPKSVFVMGDANGYADEWPESRIELNRSFWISKTEISNEQFKLFKADHDSRYYNKRHIERTDDKGIPLDEDLQPAIRVSWREAMEFCKWLSAERGLIITLPTEAQWEFACRSGTDTSFSFGNMDSDFSDFANMADSSFATKGLTRENGDGRGLFVTATDLELLMSEGVNLANRTCDDGSIVTTSIDAYLPNAFGLKNMHGNAAEWTRSLYRPYPYVEDDGRNDISATGDRVVRGGSFFDPPMRSRSAFRLAYPSWHPVHNVGFRIIIEDEEPAMASIMQDE